MSEEAEEEDAIGGTCECKEIEILVGSEVASRENGIGSSALGDDNSYLPLLSDHIALLILARLPRSKYYDLRLVNRRFCSLIRSGELNGIRKKLGIKEPKVVFLSSEAHYYCYEPYTRSCWDLPVCPTIPYLVQELFCMGTHLLMMGTITQWSYSDIWRYELELNRWFNGPKMITPRCFFASANCGSVACVAGGQYQVNSEVLNTVEKYNPESKSWKPFLPSMSRRRYFCSGFYMDSKFYVIGGGNENGELLTYGECYDFERNVSELIPNMIGECYDFERNVWKLIPNMIENDTSTTFYPYKLTDFMVVVNNELYYLESPSHHLKVYLKNKNTWKKVGSAPVSLKKSFGVGLKSLGNELLLFGRTLHNHSTQEIALCFCTPSPELDDVEWHVLYFNDREWNLSFYNCCVMMV